MAKGSDGSSLIAAARARKRKARKADEIESNGFTFEASRTAIDALTRKQVARQQRAHKKAAKAALRTAKKLARSEAKPKSKDKPKVKAAKPAKKGRSSQSMLPSKVGMVTRGVGVGLRSIERAVGLGMWTWCLISAGMLVVVVSAASWLAAPPAVPLVGMQFTEGVRVPQLLQEQWLRDYRNLQAVVRNPDAEVMADFAAYLASRPAVERVGYVRVAWHEVEGRLCREVEVDLSLREPVLPVILATGERAWVDHEGVVLPGLLSGPADEPIVRGYEEGGVEALQELLAVWSQLREELPRNFINEVHLAADLGSADQRGLVFLTTTGTRLVWGAPGESRYGLSRETKARNLVHTLRCQGDLHAIKVINVRFPEPYTTVHGRHPAAALGGS